MTREQHRAKYEQHLKSDYWQDVRQVVARHQNWCCKNCKVHRSNLGEPLQCHHRSYAYLFHELDDPWIFENLAMLCEKCHREEHAATNNLTIAQLQAKIRALKF